MKKEILTKRGIRREKQDEENREEKQEGEYDKKE